MKAIEEYEAMQNDIQEIERRRTNWLEKQGWAHERTAPGSFWLWRKEFNGVHYTAGEDLAVSIEISHLYLHAGE